MASHVKHNTYANKLNWFVVFSVVMVFGIVWAILGESHLKIAFVAVAFTFFLKSAVEFEMASRALHNSH